MRSMRKPKCQTNVLVGLKRKRQDLSRWTPPVSDLNFLIRYRRGLYHARKITLHWSCPVFSAISTHPFDWVALAHLAIRHLPRLLFYNIRPTSRAPSFSSSRLPMSWQFMGINPLLARKNLPRAHLPTHLPDAALNTRTSRAG
jgi:hypothetical protein